MSDEEIMTLIQANNEQAFNELYSRYKTPLYSYFYGLLNMSLAEELLQDTFLKVVNKRDSFRFESQVKTWIWTIAKNTLRDHWRSVDHKMKNSFEQLHNEEGDEIYSNQADSHDEAFLKKVTLAQLKICINELPDQQKEIIFLNIQSELSNQEIASITNIGVGAIKSILFRSKEKLMECFKRGGHL
jgi:RNA polymerase sigma-70 factor (ECF subfamily)